MNIYQQEAVHTVDNSNLGVETFVDSFLARSSKIMCVAGILNVALLSIGTRAGPEAVRSQ